MLHSPALGGGAQRTRIDAAQGVAGTRKPWRVASYVTTAMKASVLETLTHSEELGRLAPVPRRGHRMMNRQATGLWRTSWSVSRILFPVALRRSVRRPSI